MSKKIAVTLFVLTIVVFALVLGRAFYLTSKNQEGRRSAVRLIVYSHSSFIDSYGPGPELKAEFEKGCDCTVDYVDSGGAAMLVERLKLDPTKRVDVIVGLDHLLLERAAYNIRFQQIDAPDISWRSEIKNYIYPRFIPYDWAPMGFVYRKGELEPVNSWSEALARWPAKSLSLEDPALSTPGLELLFWAYETQADFGQFFSKLTPLVYSYSPSWTAAYGLFRKGLAKASFSYLTSLVYHWSQDKDRRYQFMPFKEGHPFQIEYAAVPDSCWSCSLGKKFIEFMTSPSAQKIIAAKNFMLPVAEGVELAKEFSELPEVKLMNTQKINEFVKNREELLQIWRTKNQ